MWTASDGWPLKARTQPCCIIPRAFQAALADAEHTLTYAREIGHAASLMYTLDHGLLMNYECGNYAEKGERGSNLALIISHN